MVRFLRNSELQTDAQRAQLDLARALNRKHQDRLGQDAFLEGRIASMESAFKMQFAAMDTLDVMKEPETIRDELRRHAIRSGLPHGAAQLTAYSPRRMRGVSSHVAAGDVMGAAVRRRGGIRPSWC
jgi:hypothetical protein